MTVLVTGATGLLGSHLVDLLAERGERPRALVRPGESTERLVDAGAEIHEADLRDAGALRAAMEGVGEVLHCAARTGPWGPEAEYESTNVRGLETVVRTALSAGARRVVHVSSITVHGNDVRGVADETTPLRTESNPYSRSKVVGEQLLKRMIEQEGVPVTIVRPGWIYGPRDVASFARFATMIRDGKMVMFGSGGNHVPLIYVGDVARGVLQAAQAEGAAGRAYLLVNDEPVTQRDYLGAIAAELGVSPPKRRLPYRLALALGAAGETAARLARREQPPPVMRYGIQLLGGENRFSIERARRELGFVPQVNHVEGVRRSVAWVPHHFIQRTRGEDRLNMDVLITGGNGFVGHHLIRALIDRGDQVRVLALPQENVDWLDERGIRTHRGDICQPATLTAAMDGADAVVHLAAMMHVWRPLSDYRHVNVTGTENVCNAALRAGVTRFVHMSSSSVYGMASSGPVDESFPLAPFPDPYPVTKAEADRLLQRKIADEGLPGVIMRPDQIFGPGDRLHFGAAADRIRAGKGIIVGRGDNRIPLVYVTDVVEALVLAVHHERAVGQAFNVTNDMPMTQEEFMRAIAQAIGAPPPRRHLPYRPLYAAASAVERAALLTHTTHRPPVTRLGVAFIGTDIRFSIDKGRRELGYVPRVGLHEGVRIAASWYLRQGQGPSPQTHGRPAERVAQGG